MTSPSKLLVCWDGNNLFRRMAGTPGLNKLSVNGRLTGALHGTVKAVLQDIETLKPDECLIAFDGAKASDEKRKIHSAYKANRDKSAMIPLMEQFDACITLLRAMGLQVVHRPKLDSDDVLGAACKLPDRRVIICSNDKDMLQCVCKTVRVARAPGQIWKSADVFAHFGVKPKQVAAYLALAGDAVDGIAGLPGCGPKTAAALLQEWGTLKNLVNNAHKTTWHSKIVAHRSELAKFYRLTKLDTACLTQQEWKRLEPTLKPGAYDMPTIEHLTSVNRLVWIADWIARHPKGLLSKKQTLWN